MSDTSERDAVCQEFGAWYRGEIPEEVHWSSAEAMADEIVRLRQRADRAERILTVLHEPSDAVVDAVYDIDFTIGWSTLQNIIRAAVAAAEQEVDA